MNNKKKLVVRIIAIVLVAITVLGLIIPSVTATEFIDPTGLPNGFEYVQTENGIVLTKNEENPYAAVQLNGIPEGFDTPVVTIFLANLDTKKVSPVELYYEYGYVSNLTLDDGYYVLYGNNVAWTAKDGNTFSLNGGNDYFIYIGSNFDSTRYEYDFFKDMRGIMNLSLNVPVEGAQVIPYGSSLQVGENMLQFPAAYDTTVEETPEDQNVPAESQPAQPEEQTGEQPTEQPVEVEPFWPEEEKFSFFGWLLDIFKSAPIVFILLAISIVWYLILKKKKADKLAQQLENDMLDPGRFE